MEEKKVYVVTAGDYSDYHIVGIFDSKEKAEEFILYSDNANLNEVEEYYLNAELPNKNNKIFQVKISWKDGRCKIAEIYDAKERDAFKDLLVYTAGMYSNLCMYIAADTRDRAIKIAADRLRQVKAEEHVRYPLLRRLCSVRDEDGYKLDFYPAYDYHTGEIVLRKGQKLMSYTIPEALENAVKVREL